MKWANFLHIYQPYGQQPDILEMVVAQCYRPLIANLVKRPVPVTINITGALLELFDKYGYVDLIDSLRAIAKTGIVEFTSSAKYHTILPFLDEEDMVRQIKINDETNSFFLGPSYKPQGFFPPEMAYDPKIIPVIESLGFKWIIIDEISKSGQVDNVDYTQTYTIEGSNLKVFFRERRISNLIMSALVRTSESLKQALSKDLDSSRYVITGMDGETFGHHRPGLENLLFEIFADKEFELVTISDLVELFPKTSPVSPVTSTWASSEADIDKGIQFISWMDPENKIHSLQWSLYKLVRNELKRLQSPEVNLEKQQKEFDIASASDQYFWASAKPWWSVELIEEGAYRLLNVIRSLPGANSNLVETARSHYEEIISTAFDWQRTNKIRQIVNKQRQIQRIPLKERTLELGGEMETEYLAFIDLMKKQEEKARDKREYEAATMWRDAIYKIENKSDIYDAIHAVDLLRTELSNDEVEKVLEEYKEKYNKIRSGQPEQRGA